MIEVEVNAPSPVEVERDGVNIMLENDWQNIKNKPNTVEGYGIEDVYTKEESKALLNRDNAVNEANTNYGSFMARGFALSSTDSTPSVNGSITLKYE